MDRKCVKKKGRYMRDVLKRTMIAMLSLILVVGLVGCASKKPNENQNPNSNNNNNQGEQQGNKQDEKKIINIGVTYAPGPINPLFPNGEVATNVTGLMFLPLLEVDSNMEFQPMLADSVTTEDNITFTINLNKDATWTDGTPVSSDDVIYTIRQIANPNVGSIYAYMFGSFVGFDDWGYVEDGVEDIEGVIRVDDKTVQLVAKEKMALNIFNNSIARYFWTIPKHVLKDIAPDQLVGSDFFQNPTVTNGPFTLISYNRDHFVQLAANKEYFKGAPKVDQINFNVMQGNQIYPRLQSGEIDFNLPTLGIIPVEDYENIKALSNITTFLEEPLTNQYMYINEKIMPDERVRLALVYAINRDLIVNELLKGNGEVINGFFTTYSPYYDETLSKTPHDPEKAKQLLTEAGWDSNQPITLSVTSGDNTLEQAANIVAANLNAVGIKATVKMTDFATLLDELYAEEHQLAIMTYTFAPVDPFPDLSYLIQEGNINGYHNTEVDELLGKVKIEDDFATVKELYGRINKISEVEVPMFSVYATRSLVAKSDRVTGVNPRAYGAFINVIDWDVAE